LAQGFSTTPGTSGPARRGVTYKPSPDLCGHICPDTPAAQVKSQAESWYDFQADAVALLPELADITLEANA
jgi:hypothetical protein